MAERRGLGRRLKSGRDLLNDLDRVSAPEYPKANLSRPAREVVEGLSYPAATAWMVARLAEAARPRLYEGVAHGDIKPSNILLTADGNPMLLDFNLAVGWRLPGASDLPADAAGKSIAKRTDANSCVSRSAACATKPRSAATGAPRSARRGKIIQGDEEGEDRRTPLFLLDEIDKLGADWRGDPSWRWC